MWQRITGQIIPSVIMLGIATWEKKSLRVDRRHWLHIVVFLPYFAACLHCLKIKMGKMAENHVFFLGRNVIRYNVISTCISDCFMWLVATRKKTVCICIWIIKREDKLICNYVRDFEKRKVYCTFIPMNKEEMMWNNLFLIWPVWFRFSINVFQYTYLWVHKCCILSLG